MKRTYVQARALLFAAGFVIVAVLAGVMYARRVETVELAAVLLFFPIFVAVLLWDVAGGLAAGAAAGVGYVVMRWSAIRAVGFAQFGGLVTSRVVGFLIFGAAGGWANRQLRRSLTKLVLYDQIDDATGLYNARFVVAELDLEVARSTRYKTVFSMVTVDIPAVWFESVTPRRRQQLLRGLAAMVGDGIRTVDRAAHSAGPAGHRLAVILPETGADGARLFGDRLAVQITDWLAEQGVGGDRVLVAGVVTFPGDDARLADVRSEFETLDRLEHPPAPVASRDGR